ncbi:unnamed protein product [Calicophoron daubneyi]|uniref:MADS-box domain-containing protein n=1 Tax=Calicophoron daubneyi TaxID=300641 RepID=A0AAV2TZE7_CALDB
MGRKKIEVRKIEDRHKCLATFRKRRDGLFKKAMEIHLLTGAEVSLNVVYNNVRYCLHRESDPRISCSSPVVLDYNTSGTFKHRSTGSSRRKDTEASTLSPLDSNKLDLAILRTFRDCSPSSSTGRQQNAEESCSDLDRGDQSTQFSVRPHSSHKSICRMNASEKLNERIAYVRYIVVDELFKRTLMRFQSSLRSKQRPQAQLSLVNTPSTEKICYPVAVNNAPVETYSRIAYLEPVYVSPAQDANISPLPLHQESPNRTPQLDLIRTTSMTYNDPGWFEMPPSTVSDWNSGIGSDTECGTSKPGLDRLQSVESARSPFSEIFEVLGNNPTEVVDLNQCTVVPFPGPAENEFQTELSMT